MNILNKLKFNKSKIRRSDFSGFTIKLLGGYQCEFVFFKKIIPITIAIDKNHGRTHVAYLLDIEVYN